MHTIPKLIASYRAYRDTAYRDHAGLYQELGQGQHPEVMVISCADSRVEPAEIFHAEPGDLFVIRNVANLVPPFVDDGHPHSVDAALAYAVTVLKVKHVVVMGHCSCGGVAASLSAKKRDDLGPFIAPWVHLLDETRDDVLADNPKDPQTSLEHAGIVTSLNNLMTFPFVRDAVEAGDLILHGCWFEIGTGQLHWRDKKTGEFVPI